MERCLLYLLLQGLSMPCTQPTSGRRRSIAHPSRALCWLGQELLRNGADLRMQDKLTVPLLSSSSLTVFACAAQG